MKQFLQSTKVLLIVLFAFFSNNSWAQTESYTFSSKSWAASPDNWASGKDGNLFNTQGIQVTTGASGAFANSPISFSSVSKVVVTYSTNSAAGVGSIRVNSVASTSALVNSGTQIGSTFSVTKPSSGGTTDKIATFTASSALTGFVQLVVTCSTNSIYIKSIDITYQSAPAGPTITVNPTTALSLGTTICEGSQASASYTVSGSNLTSDLVLTPPSNMEISTSNTFSPVYTTASPLTLSQTGGNVASTTVYVRNIQSLSPGAFSGDISHTSSGATAVNKSITGTIIAKQTPTVSIVQSSGTNPMCGSASSTFTATTSNTGGGTIVYQWKRNGNNVGSNANTYTLAAPANGDVITCSISLTNACVTTTTANSNDISLVVNSLPNTPSAPTSNSPQCNSVTITRATPPSGETWYWQTANNGTSTANSSVTYNATTSTTIYLRAYNNATGCWSAASASITVTVNPATTITTQPTSQSAGIGNSATFSVTANGAGLTYQWQQLSTANGAVWTDISGATTASYTVNNAQLSQNGYKYRVNVTGACGNAQSNGNATLTVQAVVPVLGDFRSTSATGLSNNSNWEYYNGTIWTTPPSGKGPQNTTGPIATVYINHYVDGGASATKGYNCNFVIGAGGYLSLSDRASSINTFVDSNKKLEVLNGGVLYVEGDISIWDSTSSLIVRDGGEMILNSNKISNTHAMWGGTENFEKGSTVTINNWNWSATATNMSLQATPSQIATNVDGYLFGNLIIEANVISDWTLVGGANKGDVKLVQNDLNILNESSTKYITATSNINTNVIINRNFTIYDGWFNFATGFNSGSIGSNNYTINGDVNVESNDNFKLYHNVSGGANSTGIINIKGNLVIGKDVIVANDGAKKITLDGGSSVVPAIIDVAPDITNVTIDVNASSYRKLRNQDIKLGTNSRFNVLNGGVLDFSYAPVSATDPTLTTTSLKILRVASQNGQQFNLASGGKLIITSKDGINGNGAAMGNVQLPTVSYDGNATYHYTGKVNQSSGNGLPSAVSAKKVIVEMANDTLVFQPVGLNKINANGYLEIRKGVVLDNATGSFGDGDSQAGETGKLIMTGGRYRLFKTGFNPGLSGDYSLTGGVVEFANANSTEQNIRGPKTYNNVEVTGKNVASTSGDLELNSNGSFTVKSGGEFTINLQSISGVNGSQTVAVENDGVFKTGNPAGFSGSNSTSILNNIETVVLADGSIVEYSRSGEQSITRIPVSSLGGEHYSNLKISGSGVKTATGTTKVKDKVYVVGGELLVASTLDNASSNVLYVYKGISNMGGKVRFANNAILMQDADAVNTGHINLERIANVPARQYNLWASPVQVQNLYGLYGAAGPVAAGKVMEYNTKTDSFKPVPANSTSIFGKGYSAAGLASNTVTAIFDGMPNNGAASIAASTEGNGYNLIGNPYPSNLDIGAWYVANSNNIDLTENTAYFWDNTNNNNYSQIGASYSGVNYALYNFSEKIGTPAPRQGNSKTPTNIVKSGQGFLVKAKKTASAPFVYDNTMRTDSSNGTFFKTNSESDRYWLEMVTPRNLIITLAVSYNDQAVDSFDKYDSTIFNENASDLFYTKSADAKKLTIQGRKTFDNQDVVPVGVKAYESGVYTIKMANKDGVFGKNQDVFLYDKSLSTVFNLKDGDYHFTLEKGTNDSRFEIVYRSEVFLNVDNINGKKGLVVYKSKNNFVIQSAKKNLTKVELYDMNGRLILVNDKLSKEIDISHLGLLNNAYILKIYQENEVVVRKVIK